MTSGPSAFETLLSEAMDRRGLSLGRIRYHLRLRGHDLSVATLSYWRRGLSRPTRLRSLAAVEALEEVLDLRHGELTGALVERIRPEGPGAPGEEALVESLGLSWDDGLVRTSVQDSVVLDAEGRPSTYRLRETAVAQRSGIDRYPVAIWQDDALVGVQITAGDNCVLGRLRRTGKAVLAEILLPRALGTGESWTTDVSVTHGDRAAPMECWGRCVTTRTRLVHFTIHFSPARLPMSAAAVTEVKGVTTRVPLVITGSSLELHLQDFGPGEARINWSW